MLETLFENEFIRQGILFRNEFRSAVAFVGSGGAVAMQVDQIINEIAEATGWNQAQMAKKFEVGSQGTISKWMSGAHIPNKKQWDRVTTVIMKDPRLAHLRHAANEGAIVPVMGKVGAGALIEPDFDQASSDGLYDVTLPFPISDDVIALIVEGDSMWQKYEHGDVIVVRRDQKRSTMSFIGQYAAVRTEDGKRYIKKLKAGRSDDLYLLESVNAEPIYDAAIQWVGEIVAVFPSIQVFEIEQDSQAKPTTAKKPLRRER